MAVTMNPHFDPLLQHPEDVRPLPSVPFCGICGSTSTDLTLCATCHMVAFCSKGHKNAHHIAHEPACTALHDVTVRMEALATPLRAFLGDSRIPTGNALERPQLALRLPFVEGGGAYLRAVRDVAGELEKIEPPTRATLETQLDYITLMERSFAFPLVQTEFVPSIMLRLGWDQARLESIQSRVKTDWKVIDPGLGDGPFELCHRYMDETAMGSTDRWREAAVHKVVVMTLLKTRLVMDLRNVANVVMALEGTLPREPVDATSVFVLESQIFLNDRRLVPRDHHGLQSMIWALDNQLEHLCMWLQHKDSMFWEAIVDPSLGLPKYRKRIFGDYELWRKNPLKHAYRAWAEMPLARA